MTHLRGEESSFYDSLQQYDRTREGQRAWLLKPVSFSSKHSFSMPKHHTLGYRDLSPQQDYSW